ncbi:MAG: hypothetical protein ABFS39_04690 [Pseudomonadota bacterium]
MSAYKPIACALHEHYQLAVMKKMLIDMVWSDAAGERRVDRIRPLDVYTKAKAEYLLGEIENLGEIEIRLDLINEARWVSNGNLLGG